jgi:membrane-associated phospholipid phosphatase
MKRFTFLFFVSLFFSVSIAAAQNPSPIASPAPTPVATPVAKRSLEKSFIKNVVHDQVTIWTSPFKPSSYDSKWAVPVGLGAAALFATDRYTSDWVSRNGGLPVISHDVSWFGKPYTTGGIALGWYLTGRLTHNPKARETGILALQALVNTGIVTEVLKQATQRERPNAGVEGDGDFWAGGSSFPSGHSSSVWSLATVIAYEYRHTPWIKYGAFAAATAISMSRYSGRNHFLSDIVAGSALGFGIGRFVFKRYHDTDLDQPKPKTSTWLRPMIVPYYGGRSHSIGAKVTWEF